MPLESISSIVAPLSTDDSDNKNFNSHKNNSVINSNNSIDDDKNDYNNNMH